jgi:hypothetical protein
MSSRHSLPRVSRFPSALLLLSVALSAIGCAHLPYVLTETRDTIVAVDVALAPDAVLDNLASTGSTHITLVRGFVRSSEVDELSAVVANVMATSKLDAVNLTATGYRTGTWNGVAGTAMTVDVSPALRRLEERMVEGFRPFAVNPESAKDFIVTADGARMSDETIRIVERFVPDASGLNFRPHALVGAAQQEAVKRLEAQPFKAFTFKPAGAAVYQIGRSGTAERLLWTWTGEPGAKQP